MKKLTKRQQQIIDSSLILIANGGIQNLTIKNLSKEMKITEPAIYRHFESKNEILKTLIDSFAVVANQVLEQLDQDEKYIGIYGIENFVKNRLDVVNKNPPLSKVIFAEDIFMDNENLSNYIFSMIHSHKECLKKMIITAQERHEIKSDIAPDIVFRLIMGPVRLLIKQWGFSSYSFDLKEKGYELWDAISYTLKP